MADCDAHNGKGIARLEHRVWIVREIPRGKSKRPLGLVCAKASGYMEDTGKFEARYLAFLETISPLRPRLHRYCARMTGSITDGEDVVQDALFRAYRSLETWDDSRPLAPWIFRIAHNQCIDFLRSRGVRVEAEAVVAEADFVDPGDPIGPAIGPAIEHLVLNLPPKERACVLLKDVFEYSLEETAELVESTVGGVKAALNRGRSRLESLQDRPAAPRGSTPENNRFSSFTSIDSTVETGTGCAN